MVFQWAGNTKALLSVITLSTLLGGCAQAPSIGWKDNRALCTVAGALAGGAVANGSDNTAAGALLGAGIAYMFCDEDVNTCGPHAVRTEQGCDNDLDNDGISNRFDECPDTPADTIIRANGCPNIYNLVREENLDLDEDGVRNFMDRCPETPADTPVDNFGCPRIEKISLEGVGFEYKSTELTPEAQQVLDRAVAALKQSEQRFEIEGHTDSIASEGYNLRLSQQRADAVMHYLVKQGIAQTRMSAVGYGEAHPVSSNDTPAGQAKNRRVKFSLK